jgi:hypothetical protein
MNAIKAIKIAMMLDLCPLFATGRAWTFSPRVNGVRLTVSTNRKSFTGGFLLEWGSACQHQESFSGNRFMDIIVLLEIASMRSPSRLTKGGSSAPSPSLV